MKVVAREIKRQTNGPPFVMRSAGKVNLRGHPERGQADGCCEPNGLEWDKVGLPRQVRDHNWMSAPGALAGVQTISVRRQGIRISGVNRYRYFRDK